MWKTRGPKSANYVLYSPVRLKMHRSLVLTLSFGVTTGIARYRDLVVSWSFCILQSRNGSFCLSLSVSLYLPPYSLSLSVLHQLSLCLLVTSPFSQFTKWSPSICFLRPCSHFLLADVFLLSICYCCLFLLPAVFLSISYWCLLFIPAALFSICKVTAVSSMHSWSLHLLLRHLSVSLFLASDVLTVYCIGIPVIMNFTSLRSRPTS